MTSEGITLGINANDVIGNYEMDKLIRQISNINAKDLRVERLSLLIGTMMGQISELLNQMPKDKPFGNIYNSLLDINKMAALQVHELYYKDLDKKDISNNE